MPGKKKALITDDEIEQTIRVCLSKVKNDEVFISHGLRAKDFDDIKLPMDKSKKIYRFFELVANTLNVTKKKKVKEFIEERLQDQDFVKQEIASFDPTNPSESIHATTQSSPDNDVVSPQSMHVDENNGIKKRRRSSTHQKNKPNHNKRRRSSNNTITFSNEEKKDYAEEAKNDFETAKRKILDRLDSSYKELFGQIAFCKWKRDPYRPVLILSPYSVSPELRNEWHTMHKNTRDDPKRMWHYVFWYGSPLEEAYTQTKRKDLVLYEEAEKLGLHQLDKKIQVKIDSGKKLSRGQEQAVKGYEQLKSELAKEPSQRRPENFQELHESILNLDDTVSLPDGDDIESMESDEYSQGDLSDSDDSKLGEVSPLDNKKRKQVKSSETGKKKRQQNEEVIDTEATKQSKTSTGGKKKRKVNKEATKEREGERVPTVKEESSDVIDESEDEGGKRNKNIARKRGSKKLRKGKKVTEGNEEREPKSLKEMKRKRTKEWEAYTMCCETFQTLVDDLREAIKNDDGKRCVKLIKAIQNEDISKLTAPFMEETKLPVLLKKSKPVICDEIDKNVRKDLYDALKKLYAEKKDHVPNGWRDNKPKIPTEREKETDENRHKVIKGEVLKSTSSNDPNIDSFPNESKLDESIIQPKTQQAMDRAQDVETNKPIEPRKIVYPVKKESALATNNVPKKKTSLPSLKSLLAKDTKPKEEVRENLKGRKPSSFENAIVKKLPEWLITNPSEDISLERDDFRKLGLEFFDQVSEMFPDTIKSTTVAEALECALYAWATTQESESKWKIVYREKLHKIVGALAGKHKPGLLIEEIVRGKYQSAMEMVKLSDEVLLASFEGNKAFLQN